MPASNTISTLPLHKKVVKLMGNRFELSVVSEDAAWADGCIQEAIGEIQRIENLFTTFSESSQVNKINAKAGLEPVQVDREVVELILRSKKISTLTQGAFDISYGSIDKRLWNFDTRMTALPDRATARRLVRLINFRNVIVDEKASTVFLKEKGMRIGFGGIGKGYAAGRAKQLLQEKGVRSGVVNAAGDLTAWGLQPDGRPWTIGIADPNSAQEIFSSLVITDTAIATSGNYEKYALIDGKKYAHTIDPKTGLPVQGIKSVTVICRDAEIADAMATPLMIMGIRAGLALVNQLNGLECIMIDEDNRIHTSKNIRLHAS